MAMVAPKKAVCTSDLRPDVLCCSCCGLCGVHAHNCSPNTGMVQPVVARCALRTCQLAGVLVCSACGCCGKHPHNHAAAEAPGAREGRPRRSPARRPHRRP